MKFKVLSFHTVLLTTIALSGCGGGADNADGSAAITNTQPLVLSGWYACNTSIGANLAPASPSTGQILATPHGALYGSCTTSGSPVASVNVSASYTGTSGIMPDFNNALVLQAALTNFVFYPRFNQAIGTPAISGAGLLPADSYSSATPSQSFNTNYGSTVNFEFFETGSASKSFAPSTFVVPTSFYLSNSTTYLQPQPGAPASASNFQGSYATAISYAWDGTLNATVQQTIPGVVGSSSSLTVDAAGNLSGTTPVGTLSGTITAYDPTTGTAEYTGTLTTSSGATAVEGAYALANYTLTRYALNAQGAVDSSTETTYTPLVVFIKGSGFMYEVLLQQSS